MARRHSSVHKWTESDMIVHRTVDAPRFLVFEAWINARHLSQWWGAHGFTNPRCDLDVRPGGAIRIDMLSPDGTLYPMGGFYQEIAEGERLVFSSSALDGLGHSLFDVLNTVTFADQGGGTLLTVQVHVLRSTEESVPYLEGMEEGWKQSLERLNAYLALISR